MSLVDFEVFIRERASDYDENLDLSPGAPFDTRVIQPILRRLGTDPFSVDVATFVIERLAQEFPDLATTDGDAVSDLLVKPALVLWDPIIREIQRTKNMNSFRDPAILTTDEAEALGANLFAERDTGDFARGTGRIYFAQPQPQTITPGNFFTSRSGLHFFPSTTQSIKSEEMLINKEGDSYYFDINVIAEAVGTDYNIDAGELVTIANVASAVRVTNKQRFRFGQPEEDAVAFVGTIQQNLTERSLVTLRGIAAKVDSSFSDITRLAVVGFNDPEMKRDVITGGSLGEIVSFGFDAQVSGDGEFKSRSRRFSAASADFYTAIGPAGDSSGYVVTLFDTFGPTSGAKVRDLNVVRVINGTTLEVDEQVLFPGSYIGETAAKAWSLRKRSITLTNIPGGIVFPDGPNGTVAIEPDTIHIGGMTDIHVRGSDLDTASFTLDLASDDSPVLQGTELTIIAGGGPPTYAVQLGPDLVLGTDYQTGDATYEALGDAKAFQYTLQILEGAAAGSYRILDVNFQTLGSSPILWLDPEPPNASGSFRWRLLDELDIDLVEPKETRVAGSDGITTQNIDVFTTSGGIDLDELGVSVGDILRILTGSNKGDYVISSVSSPFFTQAIVDRPFTASSTGTSYVIFRGNTGGGVLRPLIRITGIDILDTTGQPIGTKVPYAKAVDVRSSQFANAGTGLKASAVDATLGIVSVPSPFAFGGGGNLLVTWDELAIPVSTALSGTMTASAVAAAINAASQIAVGLDLATVLQYNGSSFVGLIPLGPNTKTSVAVGTTAGVLTTLFGADSTRVYTAGDVRSSIISALPTGWPVLDSDLDTLWVVDGLQPGFYSDPTVFTSSSVDYKVTVTHDFAPEVFRVVKVGSRSLGTGRVYFLEPTSAEIDQDTVFTYQTVDGIDVHFKPDPTLGHTLIPALPNGSKPEDGVSANTGPNAFFTSSGSDFVSRGVRPGDQLVIDFVPLLGSTTLADPVPSLALLDLILSLGEQSNKKITFINDVGVVGAVSRDGVAEQINAAVGQEICSIVEVTPGDHHLLFNPTSALSIRWQNSTANTILGFSTSGDTSNASDHAGTYVVQSPVGVTTLKVLPVFPDASTITDQQFQVQRVGSQRISTSTMSEQVAEAGLYYWDVELVSEGTGDLWNIAADSAMSIADYRSDGYYLTTNAETLAFSAAESIQLHLSRSILALGVDDAPENAIQLSGQSLSIAYEYSQLIENLQSFVTADVERVVCSNTLSRYLTPHFVRFDAFYTGGSKSTEILPDIQQQIKDLRPDEALTSSAIQKKITDRGATNVTNPIELVAVVHNFDRTIRVTRSEDELITGRLAAFIPDVITLTRRTG